MRERRGESRPAVAVGPIERERREPGCRGKGREREKAFGPD